MAKVHHLVGCSHLPHFAHRLCRHPPPALGALAVLLRHLGCGLVFVRFAHRCFKLLLHSSSTRASSSRPHLPFLRLCCPSLRPGATSPCSAARPISRSDFPPPCKPPPTRARSNLTSRTSLSVSATPASTPLSPSTAWLRPSLLGTCQMPSRVPRGWQLPQSVRLYLMSACDSPLPVLA